MSWLAKINLNSMVKQLGTFRSALLLVLLICTCTYTGYRVGNFYHSYQLQTVEEQEERLNKLYKQQVEHVKRVHTLEVELELERMANLKAQKLVKSLESKHFDIKKQLAFYEKIMAPEKQADGVIVDRLDIFPTESAKHYRFQVTLVQQQVKKRYSKGSVELYLIGSQNDKPAKLPLESLANIDKKALSFSFKYFQVIEGEFTLPEDFIPEQIQVSTILKQTKWQKYNRMDLEFAWQELAPAIEQSTALILD